MDVQGMPWTEIDFPEDLDHARRKVWPSIDGQAKKVNGVYFPEASMIRGPRFA
ncbi:MAG: hypothetical protein O3A92_06475 [Verrucomicrobia bacterium]|nr:hypothetical protein [Verrucomicrobiota bacterium]